MKIYTDEMYNEKHLDNVHGSTAESTVGILRMTYAEAAQKSMQQWLEFIALGDKDTPGDPKRLPEAVSEMMDILDAADDKYIIWGLYKAVQSICRQQKDNRMLMKICAGIKLSLIEYMTTNWDKSWVLTVLYYNI